ncbi:MAG TPA: MBL fold metallo-hydrolase [Proteobacteria bacterium]|nr:MBL fold metallo-hydrolase [Pseudomonadota bacterium]
MRLLTQLFLILSFFADLAFSSEEPGGALELHFIDVGYGDSILIKSPAGRYSLIDTGYPRASEALLNYLREQKVDTLDYLIMTHPHPDHLGAAVEVLNNFQVHNLRDNGQSIDQFDERLTQRMGNEYEKKFRGQPNYRTLTAGDSIKWGDIIMDILWPPIPLPSPDWNTNSMVIMLRYGKFRALLAADLNQRGEKELLKNKELSLRADLLKVGHHGAGDATGPEFIKAVSPKLAVISVGKNPWSYPSPVVIRRLQEAGVKVFRTDRDGSIKFRYHPDEGIRIMN